MRGLTTKTVAEGYFAAMQRIEQRLDIVPEPSQETNDEVVQGTGTHNTIPTH